jgi:hypothetical protein
VCFFFGSFSARQSKFLFLRDKKISGESFENENISTQRRNARKKVLVVVGVYVNFE